ncbi:MAG: ABC transporter substrate-binding protein [Acidobacteriota bacterium]|nr:ABC transporter substrate-binding protein [Acidobacteriota bacterium]
MNSTHKRAARAASFAAVAALVAAGCSSSSKTTPAASAGTSSTTAGSSPTTPATTAPVAPASVSIAAFPASMPSLPIFAANRLGYFQKNGIDATVVKTTSGSAAVQALVAGGAQFAIGTIPEAVNVRSKGVDLRVVSSLYSQFPQDLWCNNSVSVPHAHQYPAIMQDLKGVSVGITSQGSLTADMVNYSQMAAGLPLTYLKVVSVGSAASGIAALQSGSVQCVVAYEPMEYELTQMNLGRSVLSWEKDEGPTEFATYAYTQVDAQNSYLTAHADVAKRVQTALNAADTFISDPANAAAVAQAVAPDFPGLSVAALTSIIQDHVSHDVSATITPTQVQNAETVGQKIGEVSGAALPFSEVVWNG